MLNNVSVHGYIRSKYSKKMMSGLLSKSVRKFLKDINNKMKLVMKKMRLSL